ncbi:MAG TPA: hypothetical protein VEX36_09295 [Thermoleophilaceae bacterium]|nr:hypothetical protein [Thermoleophilaceae bacterium]
MMRARGADAGRIMAAIGPSCLALGGRAGYGRIVAAIGPVDRRPTG